MLTAYCSLSSRLPLIVNAFLQGLGLGFSLIIAIGAQNAFVLRQGLRRRHRLITAFICFGCDAILIALGVAGFGNMIEKVAAVADSGEVGRYTLSVLLRITFFPFCSDDATVANERHRAHPSDAEIVRRCRARI